MKERLLTAAVALPVLILSIILPWILPVYPETAWLFVFLVAVAIIAGLFEYFSLTKKLELKADASLGYVFAGLFFIAFVFDAPGKAPELLSATTIVFLISLLISQTFRFQKDFSKMLGGVGVTLLGVLWIAFLGSYLVAIRVGFEYSVVTSLSSKILLYFFLVTMGSDAGAYFIGKKFGKRKLVPKISPNKTWEGFVGGIILAIGFAALSTLLFFPEFPYQASVSLAVAMSLIGVGGDLTASAMKRGSKTKDAASILPGHGGLLDRLDSLLFNAPIMFYFARYYFF
ncbi:MAG: phosphatidate cytidylyltransferase [Acidobacteriota bacterium]|nr:phosphatidate cytidylyltransferase [Acidobacteriota bacterium]MDH3528717.1 phosphatidate cytidylyltransferase [Acidobacteriota bacterium]